jgi:acyl-CoA synthetase (NDP forming)
LTEIQSKELFKQAWISVVDIQLATSREEAISISRELGLQVVLQIVPPDVVHKSSAGIKWR